MTDDEQKLVDLFLQALALINNHPDEFVYLAMQPGAYEALEDLIAEWEIYEDQRWYWTKEWQEKERLAEEDIAAGRYEDFDNMDDFFKGLMEDE